MNSVIVSILVILLLGTLGIIIWTKVLAPTNTTNDSEPSIDTILKYSVDIPEITTNLKSDEYVRISFKVQTNSKKAKTELEKRDFQINNLVIQELSETNSEELEGKVGKETLESTMQNMINDLMQNGKVVKVYITSCVIS